MDRAPNARTAHSRAPRRLRELRGPRGCIRGLQGREVERGAGRGEGDGPPGVPHAVRNVGNQPAKIVNIHQPAQRFESFWRDMHRLIHNGKIKRLPPREPRSAIYVAMLFGNYPDEIRATRPPSVVFKALALVGWVLRFKI